MSDKKLHEYDGISELDNQLPRWWINGFYLTIVFGVLYGGWYHLGNGQSIQEEFEADRNEVAARVAIHAPKLAIPADEALVAFSKNKDRLAAGKSKFTQNCASCHAVDGGGGIGPNLIDRFWIHGGKPQDLFRTIQKGVLDKGMPPWEALMSSDDLISVTAFVISLRETPAAQPKGPQGIEEK